MPIDYRDEKTVDAVPCPYCESAVGVWCVTRPGSTEEIVSVHWERREAWQRVRGPVPQGESVRCACGHTARQHGNPPTAPGCKRCDCPRTRDEVRA